MNQRRLVEYGYWKCLVTWKILGAVSLPGLSGDCLFHIPRTFQYKAVMHSVWSTAPKETDIKT